MKSDGTIAARLHNLLSREKITQRELAKRCGISEATVTRYMKGERVPYGQNLIKMADVLGTTTDYILGKNEHYDLNLKEALDVVRRNIDCMTVQEKMELIGLLAS